MPPLTAAQIIKHPEFDHVSWDLKPDAAGTVSVAQGRGGPLNISYEIHGHGPIKLVWVMGLGTFKTSWQRQTKDFGHDRADRYTCLIWDNRGMGESDKPLLRYSTSEMARDAVELLDHLGWTQRRSLHVVGISMGGMIAQEMGLLVPERIASLTLMSTAARLVNTGGFIENLRNRINLFLPMPIDQQLAVAKRNMFSEAWLDAPDGDGGSFPTNGDRFAAQELRKRQNAAGFTRKGFVLQAIAAGWHHKSADQLRELADRVGRARIQVLHGTVDRMITFPHGEMLFRELGGEEGGVTKRFFEGRGHVLPWEEREEFTRLMEEFVEKTERLNRLEEESQGQGQGQGASEG